MKKAEIEQVDPQAFDHEKFEKDYWKYFGNDPDYMEGVLIGISQGDVFPYVPQYGVISETNVIKNRNPNPHPLKSKLKIIAAKQKIQDLENEIAEQEAIIRAANKEIRTYKQFNKSGKRGAPERIPYSENVVRYFLMKWVASLMEALEAKNCGPITGLARLVVASNERNWRRWLNGDAIPSYSKLVKLLDSKILEGKYMGLQLRGVPVSPTHQQMVKLLQLL